MLRPFRSCSLVLFLVALALEASWGGTAVAQPVSLAPQREHAVGGNPVWIAVGDLNGDDDLDAIVASETDERIILLSILLGNGAGGLSLHRELQVGSCCHEPTSLALGDFNEDGALDAVVTKTGWGSNFELLLGDGDGGFSSHVDLFLRDSGPIWVEAVDIDNDDNDHLDVAVAERGFGTAAVLLGDGQGEFGPFGDVQPTGMVDPLLRPAVTDPWCGFSEPKAVTVAQVDAAGGLDLLLPIRGCDPVPPSIAVLFGEGIGESLQFSPPLHSPIELTGTPPADIDPVGILTADFGGDSALDVVVTMRNRPPAWMRASEIPEDPPGTLVMQQEQIGGLPSAFTVCADLNEDGILDLAAVDGRIFGAGKVMVYGQEPGAFALKSTFSVGTNPRVLAVGSFNGDSTPDLIVANKGSGSVSLLLNSTFNSPPIADAGPDQVAPLHQETLLDGTGSSDPDGDPLSFQWTLLSSPPGSSAILTGETSSQALLVPDSSGIYEIQLIVHDGISESVADTVVVRANTPPVADAGPDRSVPACVSATLDGTGSMDVDGDPLSFHWTLLSAPDGSDAVLANPETATPALTPDRLGDYVVRLEVSDGFDFSQDEVTLSTLTPAELIQEIRTVILGLEEPDFKSGGRKSLLRVLKDVETLASKDNFEAATRKARDLRKHMDGCPAAVGDADRNDWIVTCPAQIVVRDLVDSLLCTLELSS